MSIISELEKIKEKSIGIALVIVVWLSPGIFYFYTYHRDLFQTFDVLKILLVCLSISTPWIIINGFLYLIHWDKAGEKSRDPDEFYIALTISTFITAIFLDMSLIIYYNFGYVLYRLDYLFGLNLFHQFGFMGTMFYLEVLYWLGQGLRRKLIKLKK